MAKVIEPKKLVWLYVRETVGFAYELYTTFDNGSLGSPIDEERSETR